MATESTALPDASVIEGRVLSFLQRELLEPGTTIGRDDDLLSGEVIDSIGVLRLATFVSEEFGLVIQPADFVVENFRSVAVIAGYVGRARAAKRPGDDVP